MGDLQGQLAPDRLAPASTGPAARSRAAAAGLPTAPPRCRRRPAGPASSARARARPPAWPPPRHAPCWRRAGRTGHTPPARPWRGGEDPAAEAVDRQPLPVPPGGRVGQPAQPPEVAGLPVPGLIQVRILDRHRAPVPGQLPGDRRQPPDGPQDGRDQQQADGQAGDRRDPHDDRVRLVPVLGAVHQQPDLQPGQQQRHQQRQHQDETGQDQPAQSCAPGRGDGSLAGPRPRPCPLNSPRCSAAIHSLISLAVAPVCQVCRCPGQARSDARPPTRGCTQVHPEDAA